MRESGFLQMVHKEKEYSKMIKKLESVFMSKME